MANDNGSGKFVMGLLTGTVVGSVLALLYAPKSGKELRGDIRVKSEEYLDEADKYIKDAKVKATEVINEGRKKSEMMVEDAKVKVESLLSEAEKILDSAKSKSGDYVEQSKKKLETESSKLRSAIEAGISTYKTEKED